MVLHNREFRRNGYCVQLNANTEEYEAICHWCTQRFGEKFGCRYQSWEMQGEWQFYSKSDLCEFNLIWCGTHIGPKGGIR